MLQLLVFHLKDQRFGYGSPEIYFNNTLDKGRSFDHDKSTFKRNRLLTKGEEYWDVKELEVYKINYLKKILF